MSVSKNETQATVIVKCVICEHRFSAPLTPEMPMCPVCYGPVIAVRVSYKTGR